MASLIAGGGLLALAGCYGTGGYYDYETQAYGYPYGYYGPYYRPYRYAPFYDPFYDPFDRHRHRHRHRDHDRDDDSGGRPGNGPGHGGVAGPPPRAAPGPSDRQRQVIERRRAARSQPQEAPKPYWLRRRERQQ